MTANRFRIYFFPLIVILKASGYASRKQGPHNIRATAFYKVEVDLAPESSLRGKVTTPDGKPVSGVEVQADNVLGPDGKPYFIADKGLAIRNQSGEFKISSLPAGYTNLNCRTGTLHLMNSIFEIYSVPSGEVKLIVIKTDEIITDSQVSPKVQVESGKVVEVKVIRPR
jgi:hypothetical protein